MNKEQAAAGPFGLRISDVRVSDFRGLAAVSVALGAGLTVLVGENNSGKTSFLEAIATALGRRRCQLPDLRRAGTEPAARFTIDLRIISQSGDFSDGATELFGDAIREVTTEEPYVVLRSRASLDETRGDIRLSRCFLTSWAPDAEEMTSPRPTEKTLDLLSFEMLDARRDVLEQLRNRSSLLGRALVASQFDPKTRSEAETRMREVSDLLRAGSPSLSKLREHLVGLRSTLPTSVSKIEVDPLPQDLDDLVRAVDIRVEDGGHSFSATALGMGTRSLAALLVFRTFVDIARAANKSATDTASLAVFEEPEAHLHPQAQRAIVEVMRKMPGQVVVSTHSGEIASQARIPELRVFSRTSNGAAVRSAANNHLTLEDATRQQRMLLGRNAAALFARAAIVVEGEAEHAMIDVFANTWWRAAGGNHVHGIEVVALDGVGSAKHVVPALESWGVPWWLVVDGDQAGLDALAAAATVMKRQLDGNSTEVVVLSPTLEKYFIGQPDIVDAVWAAGRAWADESIDDWATRLHGGMAKGGVRRDYNSAGKEQRVALDWLCDHKGVAGSHVAREVASVNLADGRPRLPDAIRQLFERIDRRLGVAP